MKKNDIFLGIYLLAAVVFLIIPIPSTMLDWLILFNISMSLIIVFNCLFTSETLNMSGFPTLLLFTTVFRISLNVSSTRLILSTGNPGKVVQVFGSFVGGGNLVIGAIVFIVLIIVQMMVINKGSERVSEVTARFTLDAMPGKQMAIDADLSSGAMDGASKYVKGDATAGLIITLINIVGGLIMGMTQQGLSFSDAISKYTILTIGDGLVSQIPSMMISLSTGILVTKASKEENIGDILIGQLFSIPKVLLLVGITMLLFGIFTPLNFFFCAVYGVLFIVLSFSVKGKEEAQAIKEEVEEEEVQAEEVRRHENVNSLLQVDPIELEFGYGIIPLADVNQGGDLLDRVVMIRRQIALELGAVVPIIRLRDNIQLNPNQYIIKIKGIQVSEGEILFDHYMAMNPGYVEDEIVGIPTLEPAFHVDYGIPAGTRRITWLYRC